MPELPEVERARRTLEEALDRTIVDVDDTDEWVCRPHRPGDIAAALRGGRLVAAHRLGKTMWCETADARGEPGPHLGVHLGMGGRIVVVDDAADDPPRRPQWNRFTMTFADGGQLRLHDTRRLGRVRLEPDLDAIGPDAERIRPAEFRERVARSRSAVKARLLDQSVLSGVGNLLADETLWQARLAPSAPADRLSRAELDRLHTALRTSLRNAIRKGGVHTGEVIESRRAGATCPRCGTPMAHGKVGGRTTWWCPREQA
ncbi:Fpg/Nei family DNA glycosylase [Pseudonocardia sp. CA-107938]|uniref:Fpg/Nei family DNA glycosylase n=1 Tax=Pseudonocardia sp. CA-107938 TaxID=3240021 RepID=UPI003D8C5001